MPPFPWDALAPAAGIARAHPDGLVDLSVGTPVDPVPALVREALAAAADSPGYPLTRGTAELRAAAAGWLARRHDVRVSPDAILPVIGTKEFIAALPAALGCGPDDAVIFPELAYPTYEVGARLAGASPLAADLGATDQGAANLSAGAASAGDLSAGDLSAGAASAGAASAAAGRRVRLAWVNSPSNPTGRVLSAAELAEAVSWARRRGAVLASDECYIDLGFEARPVSVLHPAACGGSHDGLLAVFSLSKRSNLAGYRAGFVTGDPALVAGLLELRRHAGLMVPGPVQRAMVVALNDDQHAQAQFARYAARRGVLRPALERAGWAVTYSQAGLYLWAARPGYDCWDSVRALAETGILVAPGRFYGPAGAGHIRVALTATDERIAAAAKRLG